MRRVFLFVCYDFADDVLEECFPPFSIWQLRRICQNMVKTIADVSDHRLYLIT